MKKAWEGVQSVIEMDEPSDVGNCLGVNHILGWKTINKDEKGLNGTVVRTIQYDMRDFMNSCVESYTAKCGGDTKLRKVGTPFLPEPKHEYDDDSAQGGTLGKIATSVLMKVLYGARAARYDLLKPVQALAAKVSKWTKDCDLRLHRLMCYIWTTKDIMMEGHVGDMINDCKVRIFADADFATEADGRSTSGAFEELFGPNTSMPFLGKSAKQGCVAHCTPEAEIVAANMALRSIGIPAMDFWKGLFGKDLLICEYMEDNSATLQIIESGKNPKLKHVCRTQKVNIKWLHDVFTQNRELVFMTLCPTKEQKADIFTKPFTGIPEWRHACSLIGINIPTSIFQGLSVDNKLSSGDKYAKGAIGGAAAFTTNTQPNCSTCSEHIIQRRNNKCCDFCCILGAVNRNNSHPASLPK